MSDKIMSGPKPKNSRSMNAFDLSKNIGFTAKLGEILPLYYFDVSPGDKVKINFSSFTRTIPLNQSGFLSVREHYNAYFVPYRLLYKAMPALLTQMYGETNIAATAISQSQMPTSCPMMDIAGLIKFMPKLNRNQTNDAGMCRVLSSLKLLHYLKYQVDTNDNTGVPRQYCNILPLLAYHKIYNDYFRLTQWEEPNASTFNCDYFVNSKTPLIDWHNFFIIDGDASLNNRFVNQKTMLDMEYCSFPLDMFTGVVPSQQYGTTATLNTLSSNIFLDNNIGIEKFAFDSPIPSGNYNAFINVDNSSMGQIYPQNHDARHIDSIQLREGGFLYSLKNSLDSLSSSLNVLQLRQLKAEQRWKEITQLNKRDYKSQIDAHFGKSISSHLTTVCHYIGGIQQDLSLNTVINNNLVDGNADNKAFGTSNGKGSCNYTAPEHGIVMVLYNSTILPQYEAFGLSPTNARNLATDFLIPEYDKIGYEEVDPRLYFCNNSFDRNFKFGYAPRYYDYKTTFDEYIGGFNRYGTDFVKHQGKLTLSKDGQDYASVAAFPGYTASLDFMDYLHAKPSNIIKSFNYQCFKVRPSLLNQLMITQVKTVRLGETSYIWSDADFESNTLSGDQFLCRCQIGVTQVETCSRFGLPL